MQWYHSPLLLGGAARSSESERDGSYSLPPKGDPVPGAQPLCFSHKPKEIILCRWGSKVWRKKDIILMLVVSQIRVCPVWVGRHTRSA